MTRDDARAVLLLTEARDDLPAMRSAMRRKSPRSNYNFRAVRIFIGDFCDAGADSDADLTLDLATGREIMAEAEKIIARRLKELGVK